MFNCQGYGASVTITDQYLIIERSGPLVHTIGPRQDVHLGSVVGFHLQQPSVLANGWIQLCVGGNRPPLGRTAAPSDPHTVLFKRNQREQMTVLAQYLQQLVDHNRRNAYMLRTKAASQQYVDPYRYYYEHYPQASSAQ